MGVEESFRLSLEADSILSLRRVGTKADWEKMSQLAHELHEIAQRYNIVICYPGRSQVSKPNYKKVAEDLLLLSFSDSLEECIADALEEAYKKGKEDGEKCETCGTSFICDNCDRG
jgi:hypothetical protein